MALVPRDNVLCAHYFLPSRGLDQLWNTIGEELRAPGLQDLAQPVLLLDAKNIKTLFRADNLVQAVNEFKETWQFSINSAALVPEQTWIDIGKEIVADRSQQDSGYTYLWRDCCLHNIFHRFQLWVHKPGFQRRSYPWALTDMSCNITFSPGRRHPFTAAGLVYSQFYGSIKEAFDAAKVFPFNNTNLEALAVDPNLHKLWSCENGQGKQTWDRARLLKSYLK